MSAQPLRPNWVAGRPSSEGETALFSMDRSTGALRAEPRYPEATEAEVRLACRQAAQAFDATGREDTPRATLLEAIASAMDHRRPALLEAAHRETALPLAQLEGEYNRCVRQLRLFADLVNEGGWARPTIDHGDPQRRPLPAPDVRRVLMPIGPVAVFSASNFPFAFSVAGGDTASALAAGCPVVVKAHPSHPETSQLAAESINEAVSASGFPDGTFSLLQGASHRLGAALVTNPEIKAVGFTGSLPAGRALYDLAAGRPEPVPVYAEMGSTNPVFILPRSARAHEVDIAQTLADSINLGVGQFCTSPGVIVTPSSSSVPDALAQVLNAVPSRTMLNDRIAGHFTTGVKQRAELDGVTSLTQSTGEGKPSVLTTDVDTFVATEILREEVFGPAAIVIPCSSPEQAAQVARSMPGQLTATVFGTEDDLAEYAELIEVLKQRVGRLVFNAVPTGVEVNHAMHHGGPYPATTDARVTSVGTAAIERFVRPISFQNAPDAILPAALQEANPLGLTRFVDGRWARA